MRDYLMVLVTIAAFACIGVACIMAAGRAHSRRLDMQEARGNFVEALRRSFEDQRQAHPDT